MTHITDIGALYVGDIILLPGQDIEAEVIGFEFHDLHANPDGLAVITDMGRLDGTLSTPIRRIRTYPAPLPIDSVTWASDNDLINALDNTGAIA